MSYDERKRFGGAESSDKALVTPNLRMQVEKEFHDQKRKELGELKAKVESHKQQQELKQKQQDPAGKGTAEQADLEEHKGAQQKVQAKAEVAKGRQTKARQAKLQQEEQSRKMAG